METIATTASPVCPPHHWLIGVEPSEDRSVERWSCQRCGAVRERDLGRKGPRVETNKRYVGGSAGDVRMLFGDGGERVA